MSPAVSEDQRRAAGMALSAKRGKIPVSDLKGAARDMYDSMTIEELRDFARGPSVDSMSPEEKIRHGLKHPAKKG